MGDDQAVQAVGPFWSNSGTKSWSLLLLRDRVIAWPYSFFGSLQLALRFNLGPWVRDPGETFRAGVRDGIPEDALLRNRQARQHHIHLLRAIILRSNSTANTITFEKLSGETDEYAIAYRHETDRYRQLFGTLYPERYREKDFPATALGRLLRK